MARKGRHGPRPDRFTIAGGEAELLQIILALGTVGRLARGLDGRHDQRHEHTDDRDDDEEFDQCEGGSEPSGSPGTVHGLSLD